MIDFPNCKINLGLNITEKRPDGFHNIETVFYPVNWCDALEIIEGGALPIDIIQTGIPVNVKTEENIIFKAWKAISLYHKLPNLKVYLHKVLPMGAGLGGGSADAAFFLKMANAKFQLGLSSGQLIEIAKTLGADCAFFIENKPMYAVGKGDEFSSITLDLSVYRILIVHPGINSNTKEAYTAIVPLKPVRSVKEIIENESIQNWKNLLVNDFEMSIFRKYPEVGQLKQLLYEKGAIYASMSGSGSAVFGVFNSKQEIHLPETYLQYWTK